MTIDLNTLKSVISKSKPSDRLVLTVDSIDKDSYKNCLKEIEDFIKKNEDYVITVIKRKTIA